MTDTVERLRLRAARKWTDVADRSASLFGQAATEIEHLRAAIDQARELLRIVTVERDALRADAERYRWLRDRSAANPRDFYSSESCWYVSRTFGDGYGENYTGNRIDDAIDAAMASQTTDSEPAASA
jgi:hypothetical protein